MMAFQTIFKKGRKPKYLWIDKGKEFYTKHLKDLLEKHNKYTEYIYSNENEEKSSLCDRWKRTIKSRMWKQFTAQGNTKYLEILSKNIEKVHMQ